MLDVSIFSTAFSFPIPNHSVTVGDGSITVIRKFERLILGCIEADVGK